MAKEHANVALLKQVDLGNIPAFAGLLAPELVRHFFKYPLLSDIQGDPVGLAGVRTFSRKLKN